MRSRVCTILLDGVGPQALQQTTSSGSAVGNGFDYAS